MDKLKKIQNICEQHESEMKDYEFDKYERNENLLNKYGTKNKKAFTISILALIFMIISVFLGMSFLYYVACLISLSISIPSIYFGYRNQNYKKNISSEAILSNKQFQKNKVKISKELSLKDYIGGGVIFEEESSQFNIITKLMIKEYINCNITDIDDEQFLKIKRVYKRNEELSDYLLNQKVLNCFLKDNKNKEEKMESKEKVNLTISNL